MEFVWRFGSWKLEFVWKLELEIWVFSPLYRVWSHWILRINSLAPDMLGLKYCKVLVSSRQSKCTDTEISYFLHTLRMSRFCNGLDLPGFASHAFTQNLMTHFISGGGIVGCADIMAPKLRHHFHSPSLRGHKKPANLRRTKSDLLRYRE